MRNPDLCSFVFPACSFHHCYAQPIPVSFEVKWGSCSLDSLESWRLHWQILAIDFPSSSVQLGSEPAELSLASIVLAGMPPICIKDSEKRLEFV